MSNIEVTIHTPQELNHSSYIQTGLFELSHQGLIEVKVSCYFKKNMGTIFSTNSDKFILDKNRPYPKASHYTLFDPYKNKKMRFVIDLHDQARRFSLAGLEQCDFYFKRNYEQKYIAHLPSDFQEKIMPLGMTFGVKSSFATQAYKFKMGLWLTNIAINLRWGRSLFTRLRNTSKSQRNHWNFVQTSRDITEFETFEKATNNDILFQTRCFNSENNDVKKIHADRYRIIQLLKKNFPLFFKGGFIPSKIVTEKYKDSVTNLKTDPGSYLQLVKQAKIGIYTRGLVNSPAWKMAEYLSQGKVIIAEPLTAELPVPLTEGKELLYFQNDTELIEKIKQVMEDPKLAERLSKNARTYFEKHVHPVQNTKRILELMLNKPLA